MRGRLALAAGPRSWYGVNVDKAGATLAFAPGNALTLAQRDVTGLAAIWAEGGSAAVTVQLQTQASARALEISLPAAALAPLAQAEGGVLTLDADLARITFDPAALSAVVKQAGEGLVLRVACRAAEELPGAQAAAGANGVDPSCAACSPRPGRSAPAAGGFFDPGGVFSAAFGPRHGLFPPMVTAI